MFFFVRKFLNIVNRFFVQSLEKRGARILAVACAVFAITQIAFAAFTPPSDIMAPPDVTAFNTSALFNTKKGALIFTAPGVPLKIKTGKFIIGHDFSPADAIAKLVNLASTNLNSLLLVGSGADGTVRANQYCMADGTLCSETPGLGVPSNNVTSFSQGLMLLFESCPPGWDRQTTYEGYYLQGNNSGTTGVYGATTHNHYIGNVTNPVANGGGNYFSTSQPNLSVITLSPAVNTPYYVQLALCKKR